MQHMILKVFKFVVGSFRSIEILIDPRQKQITPFLCVWNFKILQRIKSQFMVRVLALVGKED